MLARSLYAKLSIVCLTAFFALGVMLVFAIEASTRALQAETSQKLHLDLAEHIVYDLDLWQANTLNEKAIKEAFHFMMVLGPSIELYVLDNAGNILYYDAPAEKIKLKKVDLEPIYKFMQDGTSLPVLGDDPRSLDKQKIFSVAAITDGSRQQGYLYIIIGGEQYDSIVSVLQANHILRVSSGVILTGFLFLLLVTMLLFYSITRPVRQLSLQVQNFQDSGFKDIPPAPKHFDKHADEIKKLEQAFYNMSEKIVTQISTLEKVDSERRELFAFISHDLRTPLAGLQGYLETLSLKHNTIPERERANFIEVAMRQAWQLSKLIDNLFELARLEGNDVKLSFEAFSLCELTGDIAQQIKMIAQEKNIALNFICETSTPLVTADIGKIERVITNLIENAIRYTPEGGQVKVSVGASDDSNMVYFMVEDTGKGIPAEDMPYIFAPYYRASHSQKSYKKGGGLGLAICQRLLQLHNSSLTINSEVDKGTTASFELSCQSKTEHT